MHFGNHCCGPNLWHTGPYEIAARCDIRAGEELTIDYGTSWGAAGFSMGCRCGHDWKLFTRGQFWVPCHESPSVVFPRLHIGHDPRRSSAAVVLQYLLAHPTIHYRDAAKFNATD